jgi:hypothetical protein
MKLEYQVANYGLCRDPKRLEVKQESIFHWVQQNQGSDWTLTQDSAFITLLANSAFIWSTAVTRMIKRISTLKHRADDVRAKVPVAL